MERVALLAHCFCLYMRYLLALLQFCDIGNITGQSQLWYVDMSVVNRHILSALDYARQVLRHLLDAFAI